MIQMRGTRAEIIDEVGSKVSGSSQIMSAFLDVLEQNSEILSDDEGFYIYNSVGTNGHLVNPESQYFINIKKSTFIVIGIITAVSKNVGLNVVEAFLSKLIPECDAPLFTMLDSENGEPCILVEAFKNRKHGINKRHFHSDCFNNNLVCGLRCECKCKLTDMELKAAEEKGFLKSKKGKYFYTDWL